MYRHARCSARSSADEPGLAAHEQHDHDDDEDEQDGATTYIHGTSIPVVGRGQTVQGTYHTSRSRISSSALKSNS
jgi:hypothetical protein